MADAPPVVPGLPILGAALRMRHDPLRYFLSLYRQYGPVFVVPALQRRFVVMAGLDANLFLAKQGEEYLGSERLFGGMATELGARDFLVALDGPAHRHFRRQARRGYSKAAIEPHLGRMVELVERHTACWQPGDVVPVLPFFQRLVTDQLGEAIMGRPPGPLFDDIWTFMNVMMNVLIMKTRPRWFLRLPRYRRAKQRVFEFAEEVLEQHRTGALPPTPLMEDLLAMTDVEGNPVPEGDLRAGVIGPYLAGMDTVAATLAFMIYGVLRYPHEGVRADAARAVAAPGELKELVYLKAATTECMRLWPVAAFTPRTATRDFEFGGRHIAEGSDMLIGQCVTHLMEEYFPDPDRYDLDRHVVRKETKRTGIYAPFSLGAHACLGAGLAEVQLMITMAALIDRFELELVKPDQPMRVHSTPIPNPGKDFSIRVVRRR